MNCYSTTLMAKLHCNIYSIVVKCCRTFCLHAYFWRLRISQVFFNISSVRSLSPPAMKDSSHLISTFIILFYLLLTLIKIPQHHIYLFSSSSSGYEKHISMWYLCFSFFSGQLTSFINSAPSNISIYVSFSIFLNVFNLNLLLVSACLM